MFFEYNNKQYNVNIYDSLQSLLENEQLIKLPLKGWMQLLIFKDNYVHHSELQTILKVLINQHDKSPEVNSFIYNNNSYWFDKDTRVGLMNLANCSGESMDIVLGDNIIEISTEKFKKFLQQLEVYAAKCFVNTQKHLNEHKKLNTIEELVDYDYTSGYPEKITLE